MIHLVHMPFLSVLYPSLGIPVLSAMLRQAGIPCECRYFNNDFANRVGIEVYEMVACGKKVDARVLEWLFADELWPCEDEAQRDRLLFEYLDIDPQSNLAGWLCATKKNVIPAFLDECVEQLGLTNGCEVVGFSCLFQTLPSLALGKRIKQRYQNAVLVYGGAGFHGCVGEELFEKCRFIDVAVLGEAEAIAVPLFAALGRGEAPEHMDGVCYRDRISGEIWLQKQTPPDPDCFINGVIPDFDDYYAELARAGLSGACQSYEKQMLIPFESSRGCWWHEKSPCRFCGLNGVGKGYRKREARKVADLLRYYRERYGAVRFQACDNNLSMDYFHTLLPMLQTEFEDGEIELFYCVKSNLGDRQVREMAQAHIKYAQPGIESLSDRLLQCMNKGVTALQNIAYLKYARQYGVYTLWYMLMCMYGEKREDYEEMCALIPLLAHLNPPGGSRSFIRCHRYSVYFEQKETYFSEIKPEKWYSLLYPKTFELDRLAYFFDHTWKDGSNHQAEYTALSNAMERWRGQWRLAERVPELFYKTADDGTVLIIDTRSGKRVQMALDEVESVIFTKLDDVISLDRILEKTADVCAKEQTVNILQMFCAYGLAVQRNGKYLGLALREGFYSWTAEERSGLMQN